MFVALIMFLVGERCHLKKEFCSNFKGHAFDFSIEGVGIRMVKFFAIVYISLIAHELGHAIAFLLQGIKIAEITVFPIRISMCEKKIRVGISVNILYSGIVIPKIPQLDIETEREFKKKYEMALLAGPSINAVIFLMSTLARISYHNDLLDCLLVINLFMVINCFAENAIVLGDCVAYKRIRKCRGTFLLVLSTIYLRDEKKNKDNACYILTELSKEIDSQGNEKIKSKMQNIRETIMSIEW